MTRNEWYRNTIKIGWILFVAAMYNFVFRLWIGILEALYGNRDRY
jgi:hypothetical protein